MNEKILEKLKDKEFLEKIFSLKTKEEIMKAFSQENIEVTEAEVEQLGDIIAQTVSKLSDMPESELEKVSGGDIDIEDIIVGVPRGLTRIFFAPAEGVSNAVKDATHKVDDDTSVGAVLSDKGLANLAYVGVAALECYGVYKYRNELGSGAKWICNKGKAGASWVGNKVKDTWNARKK